MKPAFQTVVLSFALPFGTFMFAQTKTPSIDVGTLEPNLPVESAALSNTSVSASSALHFVLSPEPTKRDNNVLEAKR
jgi:hypothetical protein